MRPTGRIKMALITLSDNAPAYTRATERLRQSEIDARRAWAAHEVRTLREAPERRGWLARVMGR